MSRVERIGDATLYLSDCRHILRGFIAPQREGLTAHPKYADPVPYDDAARARIATAWHLYSVGAGTLVQRRLGDYDYEYIYQRRRRSDPSRVLADAGEAGRT